MIGNEPRSMVSETFRQEFRGPFDDLTGMVRMRAAGRLPVFLIGDGNYGDGLIRWGAQVFFEDAGMKMRELDMSYRRQKALALGIAAADPYGVRTSFFFNGGGGWAQHCSTGLRTVARQMKACADVFVLPTTFEIMPLHRRPTAYRRDHTVSRDVVPDAPFCHDMAFYLALLPRERWFHDADPLPRKSKGVFFRTDNEARIRHGNDLPGNVDLSQFGNHLSDIQGFLAEIDRCDEVITDRLHVAIAGVLLGRQVTLVPGTTSKIRAVYEASIGPYFDNCELVADAEALRRAQC